VPRAIGKAVVRNRLKRRLREAVRLELHLLEPSWNIVINPRRSGLEAPFETLLRDVERLFLRCKA
jgi:ribonuclease P protein component